MLISVEHLSKRQNIKEIVNDVSFAIEDRDKIALIGVNGTGKTTLLRMLAGLETYEEGSITKKSGLRVSYLPQDPVFDEDDTILHQILSMDKEIQEFEAKSILGKLGISDSSLNISHLSGGQRKRVALARALLKPCDLLILDEPTNHLDNEMIEWLEAYLIRYAHALIMVTHDRYFLDRVTNRTMEMEHGHVKLLKGNYTEYQQFKKQEREVQQKHYENSMREIKRIEGIIAQQRQWNREKNIRTAESKEKMLGRMKAELEAPEAELESLRFAFLPRMVSGNDVILASGLQKSFDEKKLFAGVELHIRRGDRAFLLGPNGCGKTTLLRVLLGKTPADGGRFTFGTNVQIGYFDQGLGGLHPEKTVLAEIWDTYPAMTQTEVRSALAAFLFQGDDVYQLVRDLSGGEKARTALLKLMLSGANLLLLDEPTNHLDISSREALEDALAGYEGTMLIVSHDRYFINKIANRVLHLTHDGVKEYLGGYDDYVQALEEQPPTPKAAQEKPKQNAYKLRKERESERRKLTGRIARCEEKIARMDEEITTLNAQLERPEIAADYAKVLELTQQLASLHEEQERLYAQWEQLQEQLEADDNA